YLHIGRNLYYRSYRAPRTLVFSLGVVIFILMIVTAFLGLLHSLKWFILKNNKKDNKKHSENKYKCFYARSHTFAFAKQLNTIGKNKNKKTSNAKVEGFRPHLQGVNSIRFKTTAARSLYNSNTSPTNNLVPEHIAKGNPTNNEIINRVLLNQKVAIS
ncbi:hypothetical protein BDV97DRAFT_305204, partial [Delphinella strobiligena]